MANTERQAVKLLAEEIARAINKKSGGNAATASSALSAKKLTGTISASQILGSMSATQISGLNNAIKGVIISDDAEIVAVISDLARLEVKSFVADTAEVENLYATFGEFLKLVANEAEFSEIKSDMADIGIANIDKAKINWAQMNTIDSDVTLSREGNIGNLHIDYLSVSDANIVELYANKLKIKNEANEWVAITVDKDGNVTSSPDEVVGIAGSALAEGSVNGTKIIEGSITTDQLNVTNIFGSKAVLDTIISSQIFTSTLTANEGFIAGLATNTIGNYTSSEDPNAVQTAIMKLSDNRIAFTVGSDETTEDTEGNSVTKFTLTDKMIDAVTDVFKVKANEIDLSANTSVSISASQIKKDYHIGSVAPANPQDGMLWYDTDPNSDCWYKWDEATNTWVDADSNFVSDMLSDASDKATNDAVATICSAELTLDENGTIGMFANRLTANEEGLTEVNTAVQKITPEYIWSTVSSNTEYTEVKQNADKIEFIVDSGQTDATKVTFTQNAIDAMSESISIDASKINITADWANAVVGEATISAEKIEEAVGELEISADKVKGELTNATLSGTQFEASFKNIETTSEVFSIISENITIDAQSIDFTANESFTATIKQEIANEGISQIYRQSTVPDISNANTNSLWICTADITMADKTYKKNLIYQKVEVDGSYEWVMVQDQDVLDQIKSNSDKIENAEQSITETKEYVDAVKDDLSIQMDKKIQVWDGTVAPRPVLGDTNTYNTPASDWKAEDENLQDNNSNGNKIRLSHYGDLYYDTKNNCTYRWTGTIWSIVRDADALKAIENADRKATVFTGTSTPTPPYKVGDLWRKSGTEDMLICTTARASGSGYSSDWEIASVDTVARLNAEAAKTEAEKAKIYAGTSAPTAEDGKLWLDLSEEPPVLRRYNASANGTTDDKWIIVNDADEIRNAQDQLRDELIRVDAETKKLNMAMALESDGLHLYRDRAKSEVCITDNSVDINVSGQTYSQFGAGYVQFGNVKMFKPVSSGGLAFIVE